MTVGERRWTDDELAQANALAFDAGCQRERQRIAAGMAELDESWRPIGRRRHEVLVAERVALFEACARQLAAAIGRPAGYTYAGGAVDWSTGEPRTRIGAAA